MVILVRKDEYIITWKFRNSAVLKETGLSGNLLENDFLVPENRCRDRLSSLNESDKIIFHYILRRFGLMTNEFFMIVFFNVIDIIRNIVTNPA